MKKTIVFGASGFIGGAVSNLVLQRKEEEDQVYLIDKKFPKVGSQSLGIHRISLNLCNQELVYDFLSKDFDEVYQLAADSGNLSYLSSPGYDYGSSTLMNLNIIRSIDPHVKKFLFTSSSHAKFETDYGIEKRFNEILVTRSHIPTVIARLPNVYGIWDSEPKDEKVLNAICRRISEASEGDTLEFNDDNQIRSFIYVEDLAPILLELEPSKEIVELKGTQDATISELCGLIRKISGKDLKIETGFSITEKEFNPDFINNITGIYNHYVERNNSAKN
jgi:nucleoside-diphosphate-sugar epimerase